MPMFKHEYLRAKPYNHPTLVLFFSSQSISLDSVFASRRGEYGDNVGKEG